MLIVLTAVWVAYAEREVANTRFDRPNIVIIMSDDQGFGDVGWNGNPHLRTPRLDRLAKEGAVVERFYVSPVCAPTRASLLTGRYSYRTRVVDTFQGRAMMDPAEVTLAERLADAGYRCGIFGKWHLGDSAPLRPIDQGFTRAVVHRGGGIGQPSDPPEAPGYFDPVLLDDGRARRFQGYCSDVYTDEALAFMRTAGSQPFFVYLAFNAPHVPLEVADRWTEPYRNLPEQEGVDHETRARVYGMVANIDWNVGRVLDALEALGVAQQTLVIYLTDNGPQQARFNGGLRGLKGTVYEGGIRVPFAARWPGRIPAGHRVKSPMAHIDIVPTVLDACDIAAEGGVMDGRSGWLLLTAQRSHLPDRNYFAQWHRGDVPERGRACAVVTDRWKLIQSRGVAEGSGIENAEWELFDLGADPFEATNVAVAHPEVVSRLRSAYDAWFDDVSATRGFDPPAIDLGGETEAETTLTPQDRREAPDGWQVQVTRPGKYRFGVTLAASDSPQRLWLRLGDVTREAGLAARQRYAVLDDVALAPGPGRLACGVGADVGGGGQDAVVLVVVERTGD